MTSPGKNHHLPHDFSRQFWLPTQKLLCFVLHKPFSLPPKHLKVAINRRNSCAIEKQSSFSAIQDTILPLKNDFLILFKCCNISLERQKNLPPTKILCIYRFVYSSKKEPVLQFFSCERL